MIPYGKKITLLATAILLLLVSCGKQQESKEPATETPAYTDSLVIELAGFDGKSVLDVTEQNHTVAYTKSAMGAFVKAIDSVENGGGYWWLFVVNDSIAQIACDKYVTADGDKITWYFRKQ